MPVLAPLTLFLTVLPRPDSDAQRFVSADLFGRAEILLRRAFAEPDDPAQHLGAAQPAAVAEAIVGDAGTPSRRDEVRQLVDETFEALEGAGLIAPEASLPAENWRALTARGQGVRDADDPVQALRDALPHG